MEENIGEGDRGKERKGNRRSWRETQQEGEIGGEMGREKILEREEWKRERLKEMERGRCMKC